MTQGEVAFVLHTHLPWLRGHGTWPVGEQWLFEAWSSSWYPVTRALLRLADEGRTNLMTLGVTPLVAAQVADERMRAELDTWLHVEMWRSEEQRQATWYLGEEVGALGSWYWRHFRDLIEFHHEVEARGGLLAIWSRLQDDGVIEILGGPATHPYLPLQSDMDLVATQLRAGLDAHEQWSGRRPEGIWVPEMGYRPAGPVADATAEPRSVDAFGTPDLPRLPGDRPGLEELYAAAGVRHFLVDAPTLVRAAGGPDRDWTVRPEVPDPALGDPYEVVHDGVLVGASDVAAYARDLSVAYHVWSPSEGYPGDDWYRDFFARGSFGLHPSWRVTDKSLSPMDKAPYDPDGAVAATERHVAHLLGVLRSTLDPRPGSLVVAAYDTELFGHWWFEGPTWLEGILRAVSDDPHLRTTTLGERRRSHPPTRRLDLPESSWGYAKGHASWVTPETRPMWEGLRACEDRWRALPAGPDARDDVARARTQALRELAQLQCSDWPFMVTRGNSPDYAFGRFHGHRERFDALCVMVESGAVDADRLAAWEALDPAPERI